MILDYTVFCISEYAFTVRRANYCGRCAQPDLDFIQNTKRLELPCIAIRDLD